MFNVFCYQSHQIKNENVEIKKVLADLRISLSPACCSVIEEVSVPYRQYINKFDKYFLIHVKLNMVICADGAIQTPVHLEKY